MASERTDDARTTYAFVQELAPVLLVVNILLRILGVITLLHFLVAVIGLVAVFLLATWQLQRATP